MDERIDGTRVMFQDTGGIQDVAQFSSDLSSVNYRIFNKED